MPPWARSPRTSRQIMKLTSAARAIATTTAMPSPSGKPASAGSATSSPSGSIASASVLLALGAVFCAAAVGQFLGLHWAWQMPLPILAAGFALVVSAALSGR